MLTGKSVLSWFIKEHEINQQLRKRAIFLATVGFIIFCTRGTGNTATAASHHSEADSLNKLAELTFLWHGTEAEKVAHNRRTDIKA